MNQTASAALDLWHQTLIELFTSGAESDAIHKVERAYTDDTTLQDGFAVLGNVHRAAKNWPQAHELMRRDLELGRMSWGWQLRYAEVLLELGDEAAAVALVAQVYARHPDAGDAYARLGWVKARAV